MSMPNFPEGALDISCEQALNMLLGSIAMEELALSHIMNAEGEKLQYVLGTLPRKPCPSADAKEVLEVNRSISDLLEKVAYNQLLLKGKLREVLDAKALCCPPTPPCPPHPPAPCPPVPCPPAPCVLTARKHTHWTNGRPLPWVESCDCGSLCWQGCSPGVLHLCPRHVWLASLALRVRADAPGPVRATLRGGEEPLLVCEANADATGLSAWLSGCTALPPNCPSPLRLVLDTPGEVIAEQATLTLTPL